MRRKLPPSSVIPPGLAIQNVEIGSGAVLVAAKLVAAASPCPCCGGLSRRVHSRYVRRVADLPCAGHGIRSRLIARRFRCGDGGCHQQIFAERFGIRVLAERARRTARLDGIVYHLGLMLDGQPVAAPRLGAREAQHALGKRCGPGNAGSGTVAP